MDAPARAIRDLVLDISRKGTRELGRELNFFHALRPTPPKHNPAILPTSNDACAGEYDEQLNEGRLVAQLDERTFLNYACEFFCISSERAQRIGFFCTVSSVNVCDFFPLLCFACHSSSAVPSYFYFDA